MKEGGKIRSCPSDHLAATELCEFSARHVVSAGLWFNAFLHMIRPTAKRVAIYAANCEESTWIINMCLCAGLCVFVYSCSVSVYLI